MHEVLNMRPAVFVLERIVGGVSRAEFVGQLEADLWAHRAKTDPDVVALYLVFPAGIDSQTVESVKVFHFDPRS
jgi:hypothetical protein